MNSVYGSDLLEIYEEPLNFDSTIQSSAQNSGANSSCGDVVYFDFKINNNHFSQLKWNGEGCVISQVTVSLLTNKILEENLSLNQIQELSVDDLLTLIGQSTISPGRIKCLSLGLNILKKLITNYQKK